MFTNFNNRRLINNLSYVEKGGFNIDMMYVKPTSSMFRPEYLNDGKISYYNTEQNGVMVGSGFGSNFELKNNSNDELNYNSTINKAYEDYQNYFQSSNTTQNILNDLNEQKGSGIITNVLNNRYKKKLDKYPNARPKWPDEKHLITSDGVSYNFAGPGTHIKERLDRGDKPINELDKCAEIHDVKYYNAQNKNQVRDADHKFINCVNNTKGRLFNKQLAKNSIKLKILAEDKDINLYPINKLPNFGRQDKDVEKINIGGEFIPKPKKIRKKNIDPVAKLRKRLISQ
jgi:hypothetical protein